MKIIKTKYDEYSWRTIFRLKNDGSELCIKRQSKKYPIRTHEVWIDSDAIKLLDKLLSEQGENK